MISFKQFLVEMPAQDYYNNCVPIALAAVSKKDYDVVHEICVKHGWKSRGGMKPYQYNKVLDELGLTTKWRWDLMVEYGDSKTGKQSKFRKLGQVLEILKDTSGTFLVNTRNHVFAVVNGANYNNIKQAPRTEVMQVLEVIKK